MRSIRWAAAALSATASVALLSGTAKANNGRYLPNRANLSGINNFAYYPPGPAVEYDANVPIGTNSVGQVHFTYDLWNGISATTGNITGGGCLAGGLEQDPNLIVNSHCQLGWVQIVSATLAGTNEWGAPNNTWFPDTNNGRTSPSYPFQSLPVAVANPPVTPAFQDFPNRFINGGNQTWRAELALCAINTSALEVCIIGSFTWGFDVSVNNPNFRPSAPGAWTVGGSNQLLTTLTDAFDGNGLTGGNPASSTSWLVHQDCSDCLSFVPAPGAIGVVMTGFIIVTRRRDRAA